MKYNPYSVSKISCYLQCPKKFEFQYIIKMKIDHSFYHLEKGKLWHKLIEHKINDTIDKFKKPIFKELTDKDYIRELSNIVDFMKSDFFKDEYLRHPFYKEKTEQYFAIDTKGNCFFQKIDNPMMIGYIDLIQYNNEEAKVIDWKTGGKSVDKLKKYPKDDFQLDTYSYVAKNIFNVDDILARYVFVEHKYDQTKKYDNFDYKEFWEKLKENITKIENTEKFERKEHILCDWCDFRGYCLE